MVDGIFNSKKDLYSIKMATFFSLFLFITTYIRYYGTMYVFMRPLLNERGVSNGKMVPRI